MEQPPLHDSRVLFIHGLEGHPNGTKVRLLRSQGFDVHAADMHMSVFSLSRRNSVVRHLLRFLELRVVVAGLFVLLTASVVVGSAGLAGAGVAVFAGWLALRLRWLFAKAMGCSFDACVAIQSEAAERIQPDLIIGSSWGGAVSAELVLRGVWTGPTLLLAPAVQRVCDWTRRRDAQSKVAKLQQRSAQVPIVIFHDPDDDVVPHEHSVELARDSSIELRSVSAGGHRLLDLLERGDLAKTINEMLESREAH